jgi:hypothetical protein
LKAALGLALIGLIAACGSVAGSGALPRAAQRSIIPWADLRVVPTPRPLQTPPPPLDEVRLCRAGDLSVTVRGGNGATGWIIQGFGVRNRSATPCLLRGAPGVRLVGFDGRAFAEVSPQPDSRSPSGNEQGWALLTPQLVDTPADENLQPGEAELAFMTYGSCDHPLIARYEFILDGDPNPLVIPVDPPAPFRGGRCDAPGQHLSLSAWAVSPAPTPAPPMPTPLPLRITIDAPATVRAGVVLTFLVTLTNTSAAPLEFDECPVYTAWIANNAPPVMTVRPDEQKPGFPPVAEPSYLPLAAVEKLNVLNCRPAGRLAPAASATFAIELAVHADAPLGSSTLGFELAAQPWLLTKNATRTAIEVVP